MSITQNRDYTDWASYIPPHQLTPHQVAALRKSDLDASQFCDYSGKAMPRVIADAIYGHVRQELERAKARIEDMLPGLALLDKAAQNEEAYHEEFCRRMDDEMLSSIPPKKPEGPSYKELAVQYPAAALDRTAKAYKFASNFRKAAAGSKAAVLLEQRGAEVMDEARAILDSWADDVSVWD